MKLTQVLQSGSTKLLRWTETFLHEMGYTSVHSKLPETNVVPLVAKYGTYYSTKRKGYASNFVYAEGNIPILLIAHVDTVHYTLPTEIYHDAKRKVMWSPDGLGADDRAGVYLIIKLLRAGFKPFVLFTDGEETGGEGARAFCTYLDEHYGSDPSITLQFNYMLQLDRKGNNQAVFYDEGNKDFVAYITQTFKLKECYGSFTDISILCPAIGISGVNLSVGYEHNHTASELLHLDWLDNTFKVVKKMLRSPPDSMFMYQPKLSKYRDSYSSGNYTTGWEAWYDQDEAKYLKGETLEEEADETVLEEENPCLWAIYDDEFGYVCTHPHQTSAYTYISCEMLCGKPIYCEDFKYSTRKD